MRPENMVGHFEGNSIVVDLEIISPLIDTVKKTLPVVVDTGCTGDLILTYAEAFPLALTLVGLQEYTIADGSRVTFFECFGKVKFGKNIILCTISIRPSGSSLMGISLLRKFGYKLEVDFIQNSATFIEPVVQSASPAQIMTVRNTSRKTRKSNQSSPK